MRCRRNSPPLWRGCPNREDIRHVLLIAQPDYLLVILTPSGAKLVLRTGPVRLNNRPQAWFERFRNAVRKSLDSHPGFNPEIFTRQELGVNECTATGHKRGDFRRLAELVVKTIQVSEYAEIDFVAAHQVVKVHLQRKQVH